MLLSFIDGSNDKSACVLDMSSYLFMVVVNMGHTYSKDSVDRLWI